MEHSRDPARRGYAPEQFQARAAMPNGGQDATRRK
jgi:hypothetical protein